MIKVMRQGIMWKNILRLLLKQLIFANFSYELCDGVKLFGHIYATGYKA